MHLPNSGFLANASDELRSLLDRVAADVTLADNAVLFEQGDDGDALYAIENGAIEISVLSQEGRKLSLDVMRSGALFGEIALFDPGVRTATATAMGETTLKRVRNVDVLRAISEAPELAIDMVQLAGQRMRWMNSQLNEQVFLPMPSRLARKILYLTLDTSDTPETLALSQAELAEFVGATREAVSKTLSGWKAKGVIAASRGGLRILDRTALQAMADLDHI